VQVTLDIGEVIVCDVSPSLIVVIAISLPVVVIEVCGSIVQLLVARVAGLFQYELDTLVVLQPELRNSLSFSAEVDHAFSLHGGPDVDRWKGAVGAEESPR